MPTALCLCGAGARGILEFGMLKAVVDSKIPIDAVYGVSVGSLIGAHYQQGTMDVAEHMWLTVKNKDVYKSDLLNVKRMIGREACMYDSSPLLNLIQTTVDHSKVISNPKPFWIVSTNMSEHKPDYRRADSFTTPEDLHNFLYASASPPVYFPMVEFEDHVYSDGGICSNYNISQAVRDGADTLIVLRPVATFSSDKPNNVFDSIGLTIGIATADYLDRELSFVDKLNQMEAKKIKVVQIVCPSDGIGLLDFDMKGLDREAIIQNSYTLGRQILEKAFS